MAIKTNISQAAQYTKESCSAVTCVHSIHDSQVPTDAPSTLNKEFEPVLQTPFLSRVLFDLCHLPAVASESPASKLGAGQRRHFLNSDYGLRFAVHLKELYSEMANVEVAGLCGFGSFLDGV